MINFNRDDTISWLEINRDNGFFDGFEEENMDFKKLTSEELKWYYMDWVIVDRQNNQ